jgi:nitrite reductase/ring-hydroxylating ferredoxin subunit
MDQPSRRDLLRTGWKLGGALLIGSAVYTGYEALRPFTSGATGGKIDVAVSDLSTPGSAKYVISGRMWVVNANTQILALSQKCPHLGCRVDFCDSSGHFQCPCHGSKYDIAGEWITGPAPRGMDGYPVAPGKTPNTITVDTSKVIPGPQQGAHKYFVPAKGPDCKGA